MLTESFVNTCCYLCFEEASVPKDTYEDIVDIFEYYEKNSQNMIPDLVKSRFDLVKNFAHLRKEGKPVSCCLDDFTSFKINDSLMEFLTAISRKKRDEKTLSFCKAQIKIRKKAVYFFEYYPELSQLMDEFETGDFQNSAVFVEKFEKLVTAMNTRFSEERRKTDLEDVTGLDFRRDNYEKAIQEIKRNYVDIEFKVSTGYKELDRHFLGGFQPGRLYIFGGTSGDGKSVLMINFAVNNIRTQSKCENGKEDLYLYITFENKLDETLSRVYCCHNNRKFDDVVTNWNKEEGIIECSIKDTMEKNNTNLIVKYFPPNVITSSDLLLFISNIKDRYRETSRLKIVYLDYLDLLKGEKGSADRPDIILGHTTNQLKAIAVMERIPLVTVTQLNRAAYDTENELNLSQMGNSLMKVTNTDVVVLMRAKADPPPGDFEPTPEEGDVDLFIHKNRGGPKNKKVSLRTNFSKFLIWDPGRIKEEPVIKVDNISLSTNAHLSAVSDAML